MFLQTVQSTCNTSYLQLSHFCIKHWSTFLALIYLFTMKKKLWKDYVRFWKWNLKHTPQSIQTLFSRRSNLMFCITFNIISLAQGSVKIRLSCSKVLLLINFFYCRLWNTFKNLFWKCQIFTFYKSRCSKWSLEIKLFIK